MNKKQRIALWVGVGVFVLMGMVPPWCTVHRDGNVKIVSYVGYGFLWSPPHRTGEEYMLPELLAAPEQMLASYHVEYPTVPFNADGVVEAFRDFRARGAMWSKVAGTSELCRQLRGPAWSTEAEAIQELNRRALAGDRDAAISLLAWAAADGDEDAKGALAKTIVAKLEAADIPKDDGWPAVERHVHRYPYPGINLAVPTLSLQWFVVALVTGAAVFSLRDGRTKDTSRQLGVTSRTEHERRGTSE